MTAQEIREIIENGEYDVYGLRMDEAAYEKGDTCENSFDWWQDDPEDGSEYNEELGLWKGEELDGTCAIRVTEDNIEEALERVQMYNPDGQLYLLGGYEWEEGNDVEEVIINNAIIL